VAQITVLSTVILIAHTLPVELAITQKAGAKALTAFLFRFILGFIAGIILYHFYNLFHLYQNIPIGIEKIVAVSNKAGWGGWALGELKNYAIVFCYITGLIIIMDILKRIGVIDKVNRWFYPVLRFLGIGKEVIPITVIGMTLGLAYGGGLIINEVQQTKLERRNVLYALMLMSLFHSVVEDSLIMISIGASFTGVFVFRFIFALVVMFVFVRVTKKWSEKRMGRWFYSTRMTQI
jgi:spore maturation protein SpmB